MPRESFPRDIVVDLFRMAEIDQNEDLVMACVTDIRWFAFTKSIALSLLMLSLFTLLCKVLKKVCKLLLTTCNRKAVDSDGDGEITKEEFVKHALKSRFLQKMLEN